MRKRTRGFTIVELVIVIAVIAILAAVLVPTFSGIVQQAQESGAMQTCQNLYKQYRLAVSGKGYSARDGIVIEYGNYAFTSIDSIEEGKLQKLTLLGTTSMQDTSLDYFLLGSISFVGNSEQRDAVYLMPSGEYRVYRLDANEGSYLFWVSDSMNETAIYTTDAKDASGGVLYQSSAYRYVTTDTLYTVPEYLDDTLCAFQLLSGATHDDGIRVSGDFTSISITCNANIQWQYDGDTEMLDILGDTVSFRAIDLAAHAVDNVLTINVANAD